jgi:dienelactone hydrolase
MKKIKITAVIIVVFSLMTLFSSYAEKQSERKFDSIHQVFINASLDSTEFQKASAYSLQTQVFTPSNSSWILTSTEYLDNNKYQHTTWKSEMDSDDLFSSITLHKLQYSRSSDFTDTKTDGKIIFMLPGTWQAGGWSQIQDPDLNPMYYLAYHGYDVYTMDYRMANIPQMQYQQLAEHGVDITIAANWSYGVFREDVKACVDQIKQISSAEKIFMSGFSRGASLMYVYANKYQEDLLGLVTLDGTIKKYPEIPEYQLDEQTYSGMIYLFSSGMLNDPETGEPFPFVYNATDHYSSWKLADALPYEEVMAGGQLPGGYQNVSEFVAADAYELMSGGGAFTNYRDGYIDIQVLVQALNDFTQYYPSVQTFEDMVMAGYHDVPYLDYDDNIVTLPAIAFLTKLTCPWGSAPSDQIPNMTTSEDVTITFLDGYGHMDILYGEGAEADVKEPLLQWLNNQLIGGKS